MPIEFRCNRCQRLLRTADNTAGKQTKCPECGSVLTIPSPGAAEPTATFEAPPIQQPPAAGTTVTGAAPAASTPAAGAGAAAGHFNHGPVGAPPSRQAAGNPYVSPTTPYVPPQIVRGYTPSPIDVGDILNRTWKIFTENLVALLVGMLILIAVVLVAMIPLFILFFTAFAVAFSMADQGNEAAGGIIALLLVVTGVALGLLLSFWLYGGLASWLLKIARGEKTSYGEIFTGGRFLWSMLGAGLAFTLMVSLGYMLCLVPGIILALMFSQFIWLIVDRNATAGQSLSLSKELTHGNKLNLFLLMMVAFGISMLGGFVPGASLFTTPFLYLMMAVTYLRMTGQSTADMLMPAPQPHVPLPRP